MLTFALAGNPNSGKTTLFNALTGSTAHVGNWPGVTVDKRTGTYKKGEEPVDIVDLPGIYSISPYTPEEVIARNFLLEENPDCIINIVDATNLERNLYLTTQLMELDVPMIVALNMTDVLDKRGDKIDVRLLEKRIGLPVVEISALKGANTETLMTRAIAAAKEKRQGSSVLRGSVLGSAIANAEIALKLKEVPAPLFHAVKLVEKDEIEMQNHPQEARAVEAFINENCQKNGFCGDAEAEIADARYKYITKNFSSTLTRARKPSYDELSKSDKADKVLTHKIWGLPIFLVILFGIFHLTFSENLFYLGSVKPFGEWCAKTGETTWGGVFFSDGINSPGVILFNALDLLTGQIGEWLGAGLESLGAKEAIVGLVVDGVWGGYRVGTFLPAADSGTLPLLLHSGRYGLHGARSVHAGQNFPPFRRFGQSVYAHDYGFRLFRARHDQHPYDGGRTGTGGDGTRHSLLLLRGKNAHSVGDFGGDRSPFRGW